MKFLAIQKHQLIRAQDIIHIMVVPSFAEGTIIPTTGLDKRQAPIAPVVEGYVVGVKSHIGGSSGTAFSDIFPTNDLAQKFLDEIFTGKHFVDFKA